MSLYLRLNLTDTILDKLSFSEYWDEHGTWGGRTLTFSNGTRFRIVDQEEMDDDTEGYGDGKYVAHHFWFVGWFATPKTGDKYFSLFFLHEMYECLEQCYPHCLEEFVEKCRKLKMGIYIDEYIKEKLEEGLV